MMVTISKMQTFMTIVDEMQTSGIDRLPPTTIAVITVTETDGMDERELASSTSTLDGSCWDSIASLLRVISEANPAC
eukprot:m.378287 g.378287  ORF g.378287 m.378287 type:complete len:77 (+) comp28215_c0_seq1:388-618(+)